MIRTMDLGPFCWPDCPAIIASPYAAIYAAPMPRIFDPSTLLNRPLMANLATVTTDGAPRNAPMWFIWEEDAIWLLGSTGASSVRRIAENPQCAIEVVDFDTEAGILLHLGLRGSATIESMSPDRFKRLLRKYLGVEENWNAWFIENIARINDPDGRLIRLKPDTMFTNNVSYFRSGPDLTWPRD